MTKNSITVRRPRHSPALFLLVSIERRRGRFENASLTVTRGDECGQPIINRRGMRQRGCIDCGDCTAGCNVSAKNTLAKNYLPMARQHGAEIYMHTEVMRIEKIGDHYRVHFKNYLPGRFGKYKEV